jgi:hypothetical protein
MAIIDADHYACFFGWCRQYSLGNMMTQCSPSQQA